MCTEEMLDWEDDNDPSKEFWSSIPGGLKEKVSYISMRVKISHTRGISDTKTRLVVESLALSFQEFFRKIEYRLKPSCVSHNSRKRFAGPEKVCSVH